jgi:menaquinone-9 beta-reductase
MTALSQSDDSLASPRIHAADIGGTCWDVVVIGAGTGGATAAIQLAEQGRRVLLVESRAFPRDKVCGGCLNQRAWKLLGQIAHNRYNAQQIVLNDGAKLIDRLVLNCQGRQAEWTMPTMHSISRRQLDRLLVAMACESGAVFCPETSVKVVDDDEQEYRTLQLTEAGKATYSTVRARMVVAADGLGHSSLSEIKAIGNTTATGARIGIGATIDGHPWSVASNILTMAVGHQGYVGIARVEGDRLNMAAAIDATALKTDGPHKAIESILQQCRLTPPSEISSVKWHGTLPLTRTSGTVAVRRIFMIGDAASYIEPFTGEGMSWAIHDAVALSALVQTSDLIDCQVLESAWISQWQASLRTKQSLCRGLAKLLRYPRLAGYSLLVARSLPWIPQWLIARASGSVGNYTGATTWGRK